VFDVHPETRASLALHMHASPSAMLPMSLTNSTPSIVSLTPERPPVATLTAALLSSHLVLAPDPTFPSNATVPGGSVDIGISSTHPAYLPQPPYVMFVFALLDDRGGGLVATSGVHLQAVIVEADGVLTRLGDGCDDGVIDFSTGQGFCGAWFPPDRFPAANDSPRLAYVALQAQVCNQLSCQQLSCRLAMLMCACCHRHSMALIFLQTSASFCGPRCSTVDHFHLTCFCTCFDFLRRLHCINSCQM
jgi:hypothetical protein